MKLISAVLRSRWFFAGFCIFLFYTFFTTSDRYYGWSNASTKDANMVRSDAAGYYAYLPQWFIYGDDNFQFIEKINLAYPNDGFEDNFIYLGDKKFRDKYFCGTAVMCSPFYLAGHAHAKLAGVKQDGYSWPYLLWINIASVFYGLLGVVALILLGKWWQLKNGAIYLAVLVVAFGTNLFYYVTVDIPYAHVFSFAVNAWLIYAFVRWKDNSELRWKLFFYALVGLGIIVRPTNVLILACLPFFFSDFSSFLSWLKLEFTSRFRYTLLAMVLAACVVFIQFYNVYRQSGEWLFNNYTNEGFDHWKNPFFWNTLFGFNKGMFVYSPLLLLIFPALFFVYKKSAYKLSGFIISFVLIVYVISSWWCWYYGGAFGLRALVDFYPLFILPIMYFFHRVKTGLYIVLLPLIYGGIWLHQTFDSQYKQYIIRYDQMDYNQFKAVFLKTEPRFNWILFRNIDTLSPSFQPLDSSSMIYDPVKLKNINEFSFKDRFDGSFPYTTIIIDSMQRKAENFAYYFTGMAKLYGDGSYLSLKTQFYKDGQVIAEADHPYSHVPEKIERWEPVRIDVPSDKKTTDFDSVRIVFFYTATYSDIKIKRLVWGTQK